jgi:hypothetical protein
MCSYISERCGNDHLEVTAAVMNGEDADGCEGCDGFVGKLRAQGVVHTTLHSAERSPSVEELLCTQATQASILVQHAQCTGPTQLLPYHLASIMSQDVVPGLRSGNAVRVLCGRGRFARVSVAGLCLKRSSSSPQSSSPQSPTACGRQEWQSGRMIAIALHFLEDLKASTRLR